MEPVARFYLCAKCRCQVLICSHCDRGQRYCNGICAAQARRRNKKEAGRRYQRSFKGRVNHASRMSRYRAKKNKVTHQGSLESASHDLLVQEDPVTPKSSVTPPDYPGIRPEWRCHFCGCMCRDLIRYGFMGRSQIPDQISPLLKTQRNRP